MALLEKHVRALELRKLGWSYSAIKNELGISKSTASMWLRHLPLSHDQLDKLQFHNEHRIECFRATMLRKREAAFRTEVERQSSLIAHLSERELYLCGLALYWGEGGKTKYSELSFSNTDPRMIRFILQWFRLALHFPNDKLHIRLHLYQDMDVEKQTKYWIEVTGLTKEHFGKPYIKPTTLKGLTYKTRGHGTCNVIAPGLKYARPAFGGMEVLARMY